MNVRRLMALSILLMCTGCPEKKEKSEPASEVQSQGLFEEGAPSGAREEPEPSNEAPEPSAEEPAEGGERQQPGTHGDQEPEGKKEQPTDGVEKLRTETFAD